LGFYNNVRSVLSVVSSWKFKMKGHDMNTLNKRQYKPARLQLAPLTIAIIVSFTAVTHATEITIQNGVAVVDINKPNSQGVSHNVWSDLNVDRNGMIFNNSGAASDTQLADQIGGNSNLATGSASVILNEVNSKSRSAIYGAMEVAGNKAELIIANPNGITVSNGTAINTSKLTLTTGTPTFEGDNLTGYSVNGGSISIDKLASASPSDILARNVVISGDVTADTLTVVAGNNAVNRNGQVTGEVSATGLRKSYGIDVAMLGGMYANKITLISTENGVGVRNRGVIAATTGGVVIDSKGQLLNRNARIQSGGEMNIRTNGSLENASGLIEAQGALSIDSNQNKLINTRMGKIASLSSVSICSGEVDNTNGKLTSGGMLAVDTHKNTFTNSGKGSDVGVSADIVLLNTGTLNNSKGQITGGSMEINTAYLKNKSGHIESDSDINITSSGNVANNAGLIRSVSGHIKMAAGGAISNRDNKTADTVSSDSLGIIAGAGVEMVADSINNDAGQIASNGDVLVQSTKGIDNYNGKLLSNRNVIIKGNALRNDTGYLSGEQGVNVAVNGYIDNYLGIISSAQGDIVLAAHTVDNHGGFMKGQNVTVDVGSWLNNNTALIVADNRLTINAHGNIENRDGNIFGIVYGRYLGMAQQIGGLAGKGGVELTANNIYTTNSRIVAEGGALNLQAKGNIDNTLGLLSSKADAKINVGGVFYNNYATIRSAGHLDIETHYLDNLSTGTLANNNATGVIAADKNLNLTVDKSMTNYGWISAKGDMNVNVLAGILYNHNTLDAQNAMTINALNGVQNYKDITAGTNLKIESGKSITNNSNSNIVGKTIEITAIDNITNWGNVLSNESLSVKTTGNLYNYLNMLSQGTAEVAAYKVTNSGKKARLGGTGGLSLESDKLVNTGTLVGM